MIMKTVQLYIVAQKPPYFNAKGTRIRYVGLLVYNGEHLRLFYGSTIGQDSKDAVFLGVIKGMEILKGLFEGI